MFAIWDILEFSVYVCYILLCVCLENTGNFHFLFFVSRIVTISKCKFQMVQNLGSNQTQFISKAKCFSNKKYTIITDLQNKVLI